MENQPYTPAKPIVENMGLAWQAQAAKLSANKERWGITMIVIPSESGEQETTCIPVRKPPAFLASINPKKVKIARYCQLPQSRMSEAIEYLTKMEIVRQALENPKPKALGHGVHRSDLSVGSRFGNFAQNITRPDFKGLQGIGLVLRRG